MLSVGEQKTLVCHHCQFEPCHLYWLDDVVTCDFPFCVYEPAKLEPIANHCAVYYDSV